MRGLVFNTLVETGDTGVDPNQCIDHVPLVAWRRKMKLYPQLTPQEHRMRASKLRKAADLHPDLKERVDLIALHHEILARRKEEPESEKTRHRFTSKL